MYVSNIKRLDMFRRRSTWNFPMKHSVVEGVDSKSSMVMTPETSSSAIVNGPDSGDTNTPKRGSGQLPSRTVAKALRRLETYSIALIRDTLEYPPNGEWTDHTFKITNEYGSVYMFITAEVVRSCFCRRKRIDFRVMTPEGHTICLMHGKISLRRYLTICFESSRSDHGKIVQPGFRPFYFLQTPLGIPLYRIEPINFGEATCYGWSDPPTEYLVFTTEGFERNAKCGVHWERYKLPYIYAKDVYKRTSIYGVAFDDETSLDPWQRLLIIGLHMTLKVINGQYFYDRNDFAPGVGHPQRTCCDKYCNCTKGRPKGDAGLLQQKYYT